MRRADWRYRTDQTDNDRYTLAEMLAANGEDAEVVEVLRRLRPGQRVAVGGGAAGDGWIECVRIGA